MAKSRVIGLDIGTTHVRATEVEFGRGGPSVTGEAAVTNFGEVALPAGAVRECEVAEPETVASALRQLWVQAKFSTKDVVIGVGNQRVIVRDLDLPWLPRAQIRTSLPFQVQGMLPVAVEDTVLDYVPTSTYAGEHGAMMRGLLVAATKETVRANIAAVERAGLKPVMVDLDALALARVMSRGDAQGRTVGVVDVGARATTIVIIANGVPRLVRMLPTGGDDVTDAVASAMSISLPDADRLKRELGVGYGAAPELAEAAESVLTVTTNLVESVRNTFVYYASSNPGAAADMIMLTGGGCQLPGLGQYLSSATRLPVALGQPLSTMAVRAPGAPKAFAERQHSLAVSLGLAFGVAA
ncbi:type IV pilus assembly protein PilM [Cellulomonas sp. 179-A 4D5 NHS]|uniref:type IV pilus assembly protein PilM n=1 Tax=Cellulomonas sp. 179-A 4D5 NHS TaxID=3142378 RepID=UPI0039A1C45D